MKTGEGAGAIEKYKPSIPEETNLASTQNQMWVVIWKRGSEKENDEGCKEGEGAWAENMWSERVKASCKTSVSSFARQ